MASASGHQIQWLLLKSRHGEKPHFVLPLIVTYQQDHPSPAHFTKTFLESTSAGTKSISEGAAAAGGGHAPQGFSETFYAYLSQANNNGSAFAGYTGYVQPNAGNAGAHGITFANLLGGFDMLVARYGPILFALAVAGALAGKRVTPAGLGTMRTDNTTFSVLPDRRDRPRRRAHVLPRTPARTGGPGPDRTPLLRCAKRSSHP